MKPASTSLSLLLVLAVAISAVGLLSAGRDAAAATPTTGIGGIISIGATSLSGGKIVVPIVTTGAPDPYRAAHAHLTFDGTMLSAATADFTTGPVLLSIGNPVACSAALTDAAGGITGTCTINGPFSLVTAAGTILNIALTPAGGGGCAALKLWTLNGADNGDAVTGSYTVNSTGGAPQNNGYGSISTFVNTATGQLCTPQTPTPSPTNTATPTITPIPPTSTSTPTSTATRTPTDTSTPTSTPTDTPTNTSTPTPTQTHTATRTSTPVPPTSTRTASSTATSTPTPTPVAATCLTWRQKWEIINAIFRHWHRHHGQNGYVAWLDANHDGVINSRDLVTVWDTPTCREHRPPKPTPTATKTRAAEPTKTPTRTRTPTVAPATSTPSPPTATATPTMSID